MCPKKASPFRLAVLENPARPTYDPPSPVGILPP